MSWLSAVGGIAGTLWQSSQNQASAEASMAFQREVLQNRNQWAVDDLKKAGLNPILAAGATQSSAAGAQAHNENPASAGMSAYAAKAGLKIQEAIAASEIDKNSALAKKYDMEGKEIQSKLDSDIYGSQAGLNIASADVARANIDQIGAITAKYKAETQRIGQEIQNIEKEGRLFEARIQEALAGADKNRAQAIFSQFATQVEQVRAGLLQVEKAGVIIDNRRKELGLEKEKLYSKGYEYANKGVSIAEGLVERYNNILIKKYGLEGLTGPNAGKSGGW